MRNAVLARRAAAEAGLAQVEVRQADASVVASFADALPADVLLLCGIFGNVSDRDIQRTINAAPALCAAGATVIWTRHRRPRDRTPQVRAWFTASGFGEIAFDALSTEALMSVGVCRLRHAPSGPAASRSAVHLRRGVSPQAQIAPVAKPHLIQRSARHRPKPLVFPVAAEAAFNPARVMHKHTIWARTCSTMVGMANGAESP
jgi:hypothetical protein